MPFEQPPEWTRHARRFIATGQEEYFARAVDACRDPSIRGFLETSGIQNRQIDPTAAGPLIRVLESQGRRVESAVVQLMTFRRLFLAIRDQDIVPDSVKGKAFGWCEALVQICEEFSFVECKAALLARLGSAAFIRDERAKAEDFLREAIDCFASLEAAEFTIYQGHLAFALDSYGWLLILQERHQEARDALERALKLRRSLAEARGDADQSGIASTLSRLAHVLAREARHSEAWPRYEEALEIYRGLAARDPDRFTGDLAATLNDMGSLAHDHRRFLRAREYHEEGLKLRRRMAERGSPDHLAHVAQSLNNLGNLLRAAGQSSEAQKRLAEALDIWRGLAAQGPELYRASIARALTNLGLGYEADERLDAARGALEEAVALFREEAQVESPRDLIVALNNLGTVLVKQKEKTKATAAFIEASELCGSIKGRDALCRELAMSLCNLSYVSEGSAAVELARRAVELAEGSSETGWLIKGEVLGAYRRLAMHSLEAGDMEASFRALAATREGHIRALGSGLESSLTAAAESLRGVERRTGRRVALVIAEDLDVERKRVLLGILHSQPPHLRLTVSDGFEPIAGQLFLHILGLFDRGKAAQDSGLVTELGQRAWKELPNFIRAVLDASADDEVLISGNRRWNVFPWEALRPNREQDQCLGTKRHLARWSPLSAQALDRLIQRSPPPPHGDDMTAAVICPWDAVKGRELERARQEAKRVARLLRAVGYEVIPHGEPLVGVKATDRAVADLLLRAPSVLHYTGHGDLQLEEEAVVLHDASSGEPTFFCRSDIELLKKSRDLRDPLMKEGGLVFLNGCMLGGTRFFGGMREDLAGTFLKEGADAVISSALPIYDHLSQRLAELVYQIHFEREAPLAWSFAEARRRLELELRKSPRLGPAWALFSYHGNPFVQLPRTLTRKPLGWLSLAFGALAARLGLPRSGSRPLGHKESLI